MFSKYRVTYKKLLSLFVLTYIKYFIKKRGSGYSYGRIFRIPKVKY